MKAVVFLSSLLLVGSLANAMKLNLDVGYYNINAKSPSGAASTDVRLSTPGVYSISGNFPILSQLELGVGYSVFFSQMISGDMGFGPDIYLYYFPMGAGSGYKQSEGSVFYSEIEKLRPFGYISFNQRQFQSVQSSYSGFGFGGGLEYQLDASRALRASLRSMSLVGPSQATFSYFDLLVGLQLQF